VTGYAAVNGAKHFDIYDRLIKFLLLH